MTNNLDAFLYGHQSSDRYPRVLVSIVVSGTLSSRTLRCDEILRFVPYLLARRLSLSWVFFNLTMSVSIRTHSSFRAICVPVDTVDNTCVAIFLKLYLPFYRAFVP